MDYKFESGFDKMEWLGRAALNDMAKKFSHSKLFENPLKMTDHYCRYDSFSHIYDENYKIKKILYFEIKVRDRVYPDGMILERNKVRDINKVIREASVFKGEYKIFYVNFIENNSTLIWDITDIDEKDCKEIHTCNKATAISRENKVDKKVKLLDPMEAKRIDYIYNEQMTLLNFYMKEYIEPKVEKKQIGFTL
jgi:hypothetical protein